MPMMRKPVIRRDMNRGSAPVHSAPASLRALGMGVLLVSSLACPAVEAAQDLLIGQSLSTVSPAQEMRQGATLFQQGGFAQAAVHWMTAARLYEERGQSKEQCQALINLAHALQQEGQVRRAQGTLQSALKLSESLGDRVLTATILGQLGTTAHALGKDDSATEHLTKALTLAREEKQPALVAGVLNDLGNALTARRQFAEAIDVYAESRGLAVETKQPALAATAQINGARDRTRFRKD